MRVLVLSLMAALAGGSQAAAREADPSALPELAWGSLVTLHVTVDGSDVPLYPAPDGHRYYVEARRGARYELQITNLSGERVGVELTVDGLNVISGERDRPGPDRMYILGGGEQTSIRGWRTSLEEVRGFTFVDEKASYAARAEKANGKMGWIEMAVYREQRRRPELQERESSKRSRDEAAPPSAAGRAAPAPAPESTYPGTGWGDRLPDSVRLVDFEAERRPAQQMVVRYEYRAALVALGVLPKYDPRLDQRERGDGGFAKPPRW